MATVTGKAENTEETKSPGTNETSVLQSVGKFMTELSTDTSWVGQLEKVHSAIVASSLGGETLSGSNGVEIVDITQDFAWTKNNFVSNGGSQLNNNFIPQCYVVERKQVISSSISNLINVFASVSQTATKVNQAKLEQLGGLSAIRSLEDAIGGLFNMTNNGSETSEKKTTETPQNNNNSTPSQNANGNQTSSGSGTTPAQTPSDNASSGTPSPSGTPTPTPAATETSTPQQPQGSGATSSQAPTTSNNTSNSNSAIGSALKSTLKVTLTTISNAISYLIPANIDEIKSSSNLNDGGVLMPYSYLYFTSPTNKKFVFPMMNEYSSNADIQNQFGDTVNTTSFTGGSGKIMEGILEFPQFAASVVTDIISITDALVNRNPETVNQHFTEKAKFFNQPAGQTIQVSFPLYNTTKKDAWKKNYKFLFNFILRNMMFKIDSMTFRQPLLYDVYTPGFSRQPLCYVSNIKVNPHGIVRPLTSDGLIDKQLLSALGCESTKKMTVNVPEAWVVNITFTSLLSQSANLMLSSLTNQISIKSST